MRTNFSRREFLQELAAAGVLAGLTSGLTAQAIASGERIRLPRQVDPFVTPFGADGRGPLGRVIPEDLNRI